MSNLAVKNNSTTVATLPAIQMHKVNTPESQPSGELKLPQNQTTLPGSKSNVKVDPIPLSTADILMCVGGVAAATSSTLDYLNYSTPLLSTIGKITTIALILGELYIVTEKVQADAVKTLEKHRAVLAQSYFGRNQIMQLERIANNLGYEATINSTIIVGGKWLTLALLKHVYDPQIQVGTFFTSAIAAIHTVPRAIQELQKTFRVTNPKEHTWEIARNTFVHGFNATYSLYTVGNLFYGLFTPPQAPIFPTNKDVSLNTPPKMPPTIVIPSALNQDTKCKLAKDIVSELSPMSPEEQDQQINYLLESFKQNSTEKKAIHQISLVLHPDKNPQCSEVAQKAQTIFNDCVERLKSSEKKTSAPPTTPLEHYNHPREARRIAELTNPPNELSSFEEKTNFSCKVFNGICDTLSKDINDSKSKIRNSITDLTIGKEKKGEVQDFIYETLRNLQTTIENKLNGRIFDVVDHINKQKDSAVDHYLAKKPLLKAMFEGADRLNTAATHLINVFSWKNATIGLDLESHGLDTKFFEDPNDVSHPLSLLVKQIPRSSF